MSVAGSNSKLSYPSRTLFAVAAVMVFSAWALAGFYGREELFRRVNTDPFHIGSQFDRFREVAKVLPKGAMLAYVSDAPSSGAEGAAAFLETQYVLAPRLLVELDDNPVVEWVLGDFGVPADYTAFAKTNGLNVVKDFGRGSMETCAGRASMRCWALPSPQG